jgi:large subunit ribosomal protein L9
MPIKTLGLFQVPVHLHPEITVTVTVNVARSAEEAQIQARTGSAVVHGDQAKDEQIAREEARIRAEALFEEGAGPREEGEAKDGDASAQAGAEAAPEAKAEPEAKSKTKKAKKQE